MDNKEASDTTQADPAIQAELEKLIAKAEAESAGTSGLPTISLARLAPRNPYRVEVNDQVAIYRRPTPSRVNMTCSSLMLLIFFVLPSAFFMPFAFGVVSFPGEPADIRSFGTGVLMLICTVVFALVAINIFLGTGLQELRVARTEKTYTLREAAPLRGWQRMLAFDRFTRAEKGNPWQIVQRSGPSSEMAGISIQAVKGSAVGAQTSYRIELQWVNSTLRPVTLAYIQDYASVGWEHAVALQAQAAEDLGVPTLPEPAPKAG